jgi:hypothetical protein
MFERAGFRANRLGAGGTEIPIAPEAKTPTATEQIAFSRRS